MAASKPIMATTIMISTSVNPCFFAVLVFIRHFDKRRERNQRAGCYEN
jgi:hypothetical protein